MRIGVVAYEMEGESTGAGRVLEGFLRGALEVDPGWRFRLFFHGEPFDHPLFGTEAVEPVFAADRGRVVTWEQLRLPRALASAPLDRLYSPSYSLPPRLRVPGLVAMHDLSFELLPEEFGLRQRWRRRLLARHACRRAARVLVPLPRVGREIGERYGVPESHLRVVPLGVEDRFLRGGAGGEAAAVVPESPYVLHLGSMLERRNLPILLAAFAQLAEERPELSLVLAGPNRLRRPESLGRAIAQLGLAGRVIELGYVPDSVLPDLYRRAELTFQLSSYEGYGLPPLESLACGTPAVTAPGMALDEVWPDYPFLCPPLRGSGGEASAVADVARRALDPEASRRVAREAVHRLAALSWRACAEVWLAELEGAES